MPTWARKTSVGLLDRSDFADLTICAAGYYETAEGHRCSRGVVTEYQVAYCLAGSGSIACGRAERAVGPGDVFINIPGHAHTYAASQDTPWTL